MLAILNSLNANNFPIFQPILMILVSKFMIHRALSDKNILTIRLAVPFNRIRNCINPEQSVLQEYVLCLVSFTS